MPSDADSTNASYFVRSGLAKKYMAGVYELLPLGVRTLRKVEAIVREEMNTIGGQEILMNVLQPREIWEETGRWNSEIDIFYKFKDSQGKDLALAPTHEEQVVDLVRGMISSYRDLPFVLYQIQTKFRNEPRVKSGLLRGREFLMKDMYSFHADEEDFKGFYTMAQKAYFNIFRRLELPVKIVEASGGIFSKYSHEFQVLTEIGEDTIYYCPSPAGECDFAQNKEIATVKEGDVCPKCGNRIEVSRGIEVGNIFPLKDRFTKPMKATFLDKEGHEKIMLMGCYGIGLTRVMATVVEVKYDNAKNRMVWPESIAPFRVHLISLQQNDEAEKLYNQLIGNNIEVLYDDRDLTAGEKFAEADLIGCPIRMIVSEKSLANDGVELIRNNESKITPLNKVRF
ncbi:MAG TPA: His/Gly/Thr/Pro-type tRNA ligase C-terminal domain-containing protein [bacterium]|nr:His/Gly/Thr/Pro-type tRNA ligase C-terminal domain-containing protein [bacterium]